MKILSLLALAFVGLFNTVNAQDAPYAVHNFKGKKIDVVDVSTSGGFITVKGGASEPSVSVFVKPNNWNNKISEEEIKERLQKYTLSVRVENGTLICEAKQNKDLTVNLGNKGLSISFEVNVPSKVNTDLKTSGGSISLTNLDGKLKFRTSGGSLKAEKLSGTIDGMTSGGSIQVADTKGNIDLKTSGGSIRVSNTSGEMTFITSGGSLSFENVNGKLNGKTSGGSIKVDKLDGSASLGTSGGSIKFSGVKGDFSASTSGGGIDGEILKLGSVLDLSTSAGTIRVDLPFGQGMDLDLKGNRIVSDKLSQFSSTLKEGKAYGRVNGGGTSVKMRTSAGTIYVD